MRIERTSTPATGLLPSPRLALLRSPVAILFLGLSLGLAGCSGGGGNGSGAFYVESCSIGCSTGETGNQIACQIVDTYQNQEISLLFSDPIDLFSVNSSTFQVVNVANGTSPPGQFFGDPTNLHRLIFRPALSFDQNGNPIFGLEANTSYAIRIPGQVQDNFGPFIQSTTGQVNQARMECTIRTSLGIIDPVPGNPDVVTTVDVVTGYDSNGNANQFDYDVVVTSTPVIDDVWRQTRITFFFDDVMNVATLLDPSSKKAPYITIEVDDDGDLATLDRYDVAGDFSFGVDFDRLETFLYFDALLPLPSAGPNAPISSRRVVIIIPSTVQDLVSNSVAAGGGQRSFIPEPSTLQESLLPPGGEDFTVAWPAAGSNEDGNRGGAFWGGGKLIPGIGGGSGRLGDLFVPAGLSLTLNTDSQTFPLTTGDGFLLNQVADVLGNPDPSGFPGTQGNFPDSITVT
ncbi:MAG: Ig-like domain-containing protein, partial [bacterium]